MWRRSESRRRRGPRGGGRPRAASGSSTREAREREAAVGASKWGPRCLGRRCRRAATRACGRRASLRGSDAGEERVGRNARVVGGKWDDGEKLRRVGGGKEKRGTARNAADGIREGRTRHLSARLLPCLFPDRVIHGVADLVQGFHGERRARARALTLPPARTPSLVFRRISLSRNARRAETRRRLGTDAALNESNHRVTCLSKPRRRASLSRPHIATTYAYNIFSGPWLDADAQSAFMVATTPAMVTAPSATGTT